LDHRRESPEKPYYYPHGRQLGEPHPRLRQPPLQRLDRLPAGQGEDAQLVVAAALSARLPVKKHHPFITTASGGSSSAKRIPLRRTPTRNA
jgi:hypothetical protein